MEFLSLSAKLHPNLGSFTLDLRIGRSNSANQFIVIAGENGAGKTQILELLYHVSCLSLPSIFSKRGVNCHVKLSSAEAHGLSLLDEKFRFLRNIKEDVVFELDLIRNQNNTIVSTIVKTRNQTKKIFLVNDKDKKELRRFIGVIYYDGDPRKLNSRPYSFKLEDFYSSFKSSEIKNFDTETYLLKWIRSKNREKEISIQLTDGGTRVYDQEFESYNKSLQVLGSSLRLDRKSFEQGELVLSKHGIFFFYKDLSAGEKKLLNLVTTIRFRSGIIGTPVLIDEPENGFHPRWQSKIADFLTTNLSTGTQIIVTTHSPYLVHAEPNKLRMSIVCKRREADSRLEILSEANFPSWNRDQVVQSAFSLGEIYSGSPYPLVLVEGSTDELYLQDILKLHYPNAEVEIKWVGNLVNGNANFSGYTALHKIEEAIKNRPEIGSRKVCVLYDCDVKNKETTKIHETLFRFQFKYKKRKIFKDGIENNFEQIQNEEFYTSFLKVKTFTSGEVVHEKIELDKSALNKAIIPLTKKRKTSIYGDLIVEVSELLDFLK